MNEFEKALSFMIGENRLNQIQAIKVGIAGAGGLGSNCAFNLVRSGFRLLKIVDYDLIELSNLNRQFYFLDQVGMPKVKALKANLQKINPDIELEIIKCRITQYNVKDIFSDCDVVIEAFDKADSKKMLVENYIKSGKLLVAASGIAGWGNSDVIKIRKIHEKFYLVGDGISETDMQNPAVSSGVNIAAAKQADIVLSCVLNGL